MAAGCDLAINNGFFHGVFPYPNGKYIECVIRKYLPILLKLVVWNMNFMFPNSWDDFLQSDELIFFGGVCIPPIS